MTRFGKFVMIGLVVLILMIFSVKNSWSSTGCSFPSIPKEVIEPTGWRVNISIVSSSNTVGRNGNVALHVNSGGKGFAPFRWSLSFDYPGGRGYSLSKGSTMSDSETTVLHTSADACGAVTVTVKDQNNKVASVQIRCTTGGYTILLEQCGALDGWHQSTCERNGFRYVVDHYNCSHPETKHGSMCGDHPCCGCSSYYCPEGSRKYGWGCP